MEPIYAATVILGAIALGEVVSIVTRARVPSFLVALLALVVAVQLGLFPREIVEASSLLAFGAILTPAIMVHMGTLLPMSVLKANYKSVLIAVGAMVGAVALILPIITMVFGYGQAVAGAGPVAGGTVSTLLTVQGLQDADRAALATIPPLILMLQFLPAMPLSNWMLRGYAAKLVAEGRSAGGTGSGGAGAAATQSGSKAGADDAAVDFDAVDDSRLRIPASWVASQPVLFFLLVGIGAIAWFLGELTGVSYSLWGLGFGILLAFLGLLPLRALERANGFTPAMIGVIAAVMAPLALASMTEIINSLAAVVSILLIGLFGVVVGGFVVSKLVGWDWRLGVPVALTAMMGFPGDYIVSQEVSRSASEDEAEQQRVLGQILPPMLVGGFTSVSAGSIVVASILVTTL